MTRPGNFNNWKVPIGALLAAMLLAVGGRPLHALPRDTIADRELGQPDFFHNVLNIPEADVMNTAAPTPALIAIDKSVMPNRLFAADSQNNRVLGYKNVDALMSGQFADLVIGQPDFYSAGCNAAGRTRYTLCVPAGIAVDKLGNLFVADADNHRVLEFNQPFASGLTANQPASWVLGQGGDFTSGSCNLGAGANPTAETLCLPSGLAIDAKGNLYVADSGNNRILEYNAPFNSAYAANRVFGQFANFNIGVSNNQGPPGYKSGPPSAKNLYDPVGISLDGGGNLYVADFNNNRVLKYNSPLSNTTANQVFGQMGKFTTNSGNNGGLNANSLFSPVAIGFDLGGDVYISDYNNNRVLEYHPPIASNPTANRVFGQANEYNTGTCNIISSFAPSSGSLCRPYGLLSDSSGNLYVSDSGNNRVLKYDVPFAASAYAQVVVGQPDMAHNSANAVDPAAMYNPNGVAVDAAGHLFVGDFNNNRVLGYHSAAGFTSGGPADLVIGQPDFYSGACNEGGVFGGPTERTLCGPSGVAADGAGNLYVADFNNNRMLVFGPPFSAGVTANEAAFRVFGQGGSFNSRDQNHGGITNKSLFNPFSVAVDRTGKVFVSDYNNHRVLEFVPPIRANPAASLVLGQAGFTANACDNGTSPPTPAANTMCFPQGVAVDTGGNLYVSDNGNSRVLLFTPPLKTNAKARRVFGQGGSFVTKGCTVANRNTLCGPTGVATDKLGNVYIGDFNYNRVTEYNTPLNPKSGEPGAGDTTADRVFGQGDNFFSSGPNLGGTTPSADSLSGPGGVAADSAGNLYIADYGNNRVLEYDSKR